MRARHLVSSLVALGFASALGAGCGGGSKCCDVPGGSGGAATPSGGASGGAPATGGMGTAGASGRAGTGGSTGAAGASPAVMSAGCGMTAPALGTANPQTISVTDSKGTAASRTFIVGMPSDYVPTKAYPVIFAWHYAGGMASTIAGTGYSGKYYGVQPLLPEAIYVAPQGLTDSSGQTGWPNTNGGDVAFLNAMLTWTESKLCVDTSRIMSTGFSYGGIMSDTIGCQMPDVFRAIAVMSGALFKFGGSSACKNHNIAAWFTHGTADPTVDISGDETARDQFLADNHCGTTTTAVTPAPCVSYGGCDTGYPVVWCPVDGEGHTIPSFAASGIAAFFKQFTGQP